MGKEKDREIKKEKKGTIKEVSSICSPLESAHTMNDEVKDA